MSIAIVRDKKYLKTIQRARVLLAQKIINFRERNRAEFSFIKKASARNCEWMERG